MLRKRSSYGLLLSICASERVAQFRAMLNAKEVKGVNMWERTQFLRYFGTKE